MLAKVEVPYRVIDVAAGDLGSERGPQVRLRGVGAVAGPLPRGDLDVELHHVPGPPAARPLPRRGRQAAVAATLNGTLATTRWLVAILENHQQPDGSVAVPKALQPVRGRGRAAPDREEVGGGPVAGDRLLSCGHRNTSSRNSRLPRRVFSAVF